MKGTAGLKIGVLDAETDPFKRGRVPKPFTAGFYNGSLYLCKWGEKCIDDLMNEIAELDEPHLIYCHNGGKFDFWFMFHWIDTEAKLTIINGRLVEWCMKGTKHVFRDSLAIIPVALSQYQKEEINYDIFERSKRELVHNKTSINNYLKSDCVNLWNLVNRFSERFSNERGHTPISIGQASIRELLALHPFQIMTQASDEEIRPWYMGGRVQCFASGILKGPWRVVDVNGMYSKVMAEYDHPLSDMYESVERPPRGKRAVWFAEFEGSNRQALCVNTDDEGLSFTLQEGTFFACSHELVPAIAAGLVKVRKWVTILKPSEKGNFRAFVDKWQAEKVAAEVAGDKAGRLFSKLIQNSAYGKTGQNPEDFKDYEILTDMMADGELKEKGYEPEARISEDPFIEIWARKSKFHSHGYYNVGIAASVTSAARSVLLDGLRQSIEPIYCDTDSIICRSFNGPVDPTALGAWKLEAEAEFAAIAGKKMYCLYDTKPIPGKKYPLINKINPTGRCGRIWPVKWASKGGDITPSNIVRIAKGATVEFTSEVPTFSLSRGISFISRKFRKTVDAPEAFD